MEKPYGEITFGTPRAEEHTARSPGIMSSTSLYNSRCYRVNGRSWQPLHPSLLMPLTESQSTAEISLHPRTLISLSFFFI